MDVDGLTHYMHIALQVAQRIADGELSEGEKISGRSKLSSEYGVSPETIRKAMQLLADMKVVSVRKQSGVYVLSTDNARRYLQAFAGKKQILEKKHEMRQLLEQQELISHRLSDLCRSLLDDPVLAAETSDRLPNYSFRVPDDWDGIGRNLADLHFWQATGATIIAIRRGGQYIISPGPLAEIYNGDIIIFVGSPETVSAIPSFFSHVI